MLKENIKKGIKGVYPFHMPGHKRNPSFLSNFAPLDVTETEDTDNLHAPRGVIKSAMERTAKLFGARHTFYVTCGSTCAILAAIKAVTKENDTVILGRNCHKSVWSAAELCHLNTEYIYPEKNSTLGVYGEVSPKKLDDLLKNTKPAAVIITSPTYEGVVSDIKSIAEITHKNSAILIVDSAHGAHLGFSADFPKTARHLGADIVIESAHKTLPCLTSAAMLHICTDRITPSDISDSLSIFETSSPSYPIMYSLDDVTQLILKRGDKLFADYSARLDSFINKCNRLENISVYKGEEVFAFDKGKLCLVTKNTDINGFMLKTLLRERGIACEMAQPNFCLAMTSIADTAIGFKRLFSALCKIDKTLNKTENSFDFAEPALKREFSLYEAKSRPSVYIIPEEAVGKTAAEYIFAYPPGSPIIAPGEIITKQTLISLKSLAKLGAEVYSSSGNYPEKIKIL